jgi:hypothetical protein
MSGVQANQLAGGNSRDTRQVDDFYATPPASVEALFDNLNMKGDTCLEPCCGQGHISEVLKEHFKKVKSTDLVYRGYGKNKPVDFLTHNYRGKKFDWVITNPPFKHAQEFIEKALSVANNGVAMFLKIQFLEGVKRKEFFQKTKPRYIFVFSQRQAVMKDGLELNPATGKKWATTMCFAWYVWERGYYGEPTIRWI